MVHILVRTIKKILHEEIKLKSQVPAPAKSMKIGPREHSSGHTTPVKSGMHARMRELSSLSKDDASDHFMGNQQETFRDNLVFISNTLLRRRFSKQKHVFDEALIGLFLNRLKVIPLI